MKIPQSVRNAYADIRPTYERLAEKADALIKNIKRPRWHFESRIKTEQSYALKLETGREKNVKSPEDFYGCTMVVENHAMIDEAKTVLLSHFDLQYQRPKDRQRTHLNPDQFSFDDLRLYVSWKDSEFEPPTGLQGIIFEIQIKTFLQHAWGIATHDLLYKTDAVNWGCSRVAYQVKAMLENAELCISQAQLLQNCNILDRSDSEIKETKEIILELKTRWTEPGALPEDTRRLALNITNLSRSLKLPLDKIWSALDKATAKGRGANLLNLSPYSSIIDALVSEHGIAIFNDWHWRAALFIPDEVELPTGWSPKGTIIRTTN